MHSYKSYAKDFISVHVQVSAFKKWRVKLLEENYTYTGF